MPYHLLCKRESEKWRMANESGLSGVIGSRNGAYYLGTFNTFENAGGAWRPSWNWGAFVCSSAWFMYRRMYAWGAINLALLLLVLAPLTIHLTVEETSLAYGAIIVYALVAFLLLPAVASWMYYRLLRRGVGAEVKTAPDMLSFGAAAAVSAAAAAGVAYALVILTSTDYAVRVHVVDAMLAIAPHKAAVESAAKQRGALPAGQAELPVTGVPLPAGVKLAEIVPGGVVRVAFTGFRHINGRWVEFVPTLTENSVQWRCYNIDMPERELPVQCRAKRAIDRNAPARGVPPG